MKQFIALLLAVYSISFAQQDTVAYRAATALVNAGDKTKALEQFLITYPSSKLSTRVYDALFDLYSQQSNESGAVTAASKSLETLAPDSRMNPYNRFAYALALKNMGLDSALAWILRAEELAQRTSPRSLSGFQDTRAYVLYRKGRFAEAEELQLVAIKGHENDPEYVSHLALYEKGSGKIHDALHTMAKALYLEGDQESKEQFLAWIGEVEKEKSGQDALKESIVLSTVHSFIDALRGSKLVAARSKAAMLMADIGVDLPTAHKWAEAAVRTLDKNSSLSDVISYKRNLSLVLVAQGRHKEALGFLRSIEELVDPYETKYWNMLGKTHEQLGDHANATLAYMNGLIPRNDKQLRSAVEDLYVRHHLPLSRIDTVLDSLRQSSTTFETGNYGKSKTPSGKVILAELFTGAECGPCAASDLAFDALAEHYPRSVVAIIEYHVHIPGPDPMTTDESWDRYTWYGGQGTPTAIIDGRESIIGGGTKTVARNRFGVYKYAVEKFESEKPIVDIVLIVKKIQDVVAAEVKVTRPKKSLRSENPTLHIALVERSVDYLGSNGIAKHAFVVRHMFGGSKGTSLSLKQPAESVSKQVDLADVEKVIKEYLDNPTTQRSWSSRRPFTGWKGRPEKLDRSQLAVVAWVQDVNTKQVFQAAYQEIPSALGMK